MQHTHAVGDDSKKRDDWGFPRFAKDFPQDEQLDALVAAFARGDYAFVRVNAPRLERESEDDAVKRAARTLRARIEPDPTSRALFLVAAALLAFLSVWWVLHDGPPEEGPRPAPTSSPR